MADKSAEVMVSDVAASTTEGTGTPWSMRGMSMVHIAKVKVSVGEEM